MKKHVKKILKKILILTLATSIIFTTCFSHKKINAHAASVAAGLGAYTLYEICLYIGGLAITTLGIGYAYENRDQIAEFGKSVIDSMSSLPAEGWILGSHSASGDYVYGSEALQEVQGTSWSVISGGGMSPKNDDDNDGDGDKDSDDRTEELKKMNFWTTPAGVTLIGETLFAAYTTWVNNSPDNETYDDPNFLNNQYGLFDSLFFDNNIPVIDGKYQISLNLYSYNPLGQIVVGSKTNTSVPSNLPVGGYLDMNDSGTAGMLKFYYYNGSMRNISSLASIWIYQNPSTDQYFGYNTNVPMFSDHDTLEDYFKTGNLDNCLNKSKLYRVADWLADEDAWRGTLEDLATSLRSLQDLSAIAQALANGALTTQPSVDALRDMLNALLSEYLPSTEPVTDPTYYPESNPTPRLDPADLPNTQPGTDDPEPVPPGGGDEDIEIDLDGLLSLFNILFYLIMIIIALIMLFLSFLGFIVMIFRIPASPAMLPEEMALGFEHLQTIMIPGMNISIYGFAMALIYLFIIFAIVKLLRLEINDFKFPRKGG